MKIKKQVLTHTWLPSLQKLWDQYGPHVGFKMGPTWAADVGLSWFLQQDSTRDSQGQTYMGHIWELYGYNMGFVFNPHWTHMVPKFVIRAVYGNHMGPI